MIGLAALVAFLFHRALFSGGVFFQRDVQWGQVLAYTSMITIPVLAVFFAFQNAFVKSIATSGIKG